jgi:peptidoglycan/xylan/chitin deacetylase (PgdA/CDA1 family)
MKRGILTYEKDCLAPLLEARKGVLGDRYAAAPRLLIRVDEFPHAGAFATDGQYGQRSFARFHSILARAQIPYLLAVTPRVADAYLDPKATKSRQLTGSERALLKRLQAEGVELALHGYDHRTSYRSPWRRSELGRRSDAEVEDLLERGIAELETLGVTPRVFVAPFNRFNGRQYRQLAKRFEAICGGPESVASFGFHRTPLWHGDAVYVPSYPPLYGRAQTITAALDMLLSAQPGLWVPIVLHWGWETVDDFNALEELCKRLSPFAAPWSEFMDEVRASA